MSNVEPTPDTPQANEGPVANPTATGWWLTSDGIADIALALVSARWGAEHGRPPTDDELLEATRATLAAAEPPPTTESLDRMVAFARRRLAPGRFRTFTGAELEQAIDLLCDHPVTFTPRGEARR